MKKVIVVTNILNPYRIPLFNEVRRMLSSENISFKVIVATHGYEWRKFKIDLNDCKFDYEVLESKSISLRHKENTMFSYGGLIKKLFTEKPDVIIVSGFSPATIKVWLYSLLKKIKIIIWSGTVPENKISELRKLQRRFLASKASAFISYGSRASAYLKTLAIPEKKIFKALNTVDTLFFESETARLRLSETCDSQLKHLTCVTYLSKRKNVLPVLKAIKQLSLLRRDFVLDLIGDGDEKEMLQKQAVEMGISDKVIFHGFIQKKDLPQYFARSSCFLFQTNFDIWGLVLNEAMAAGLPCIVTKNAGATDDLITDNANGFVVNFDETVNVSETINALLNDPANAFQIGENAKATIREKATISKSAEGIINAVNSVM